MRSISPVLAALIGIVVSLTPCFADVPHLVNYQGHLANGSGIPITGNHALTFRIYADSTGAGTVLWQEIHAVVPVNAGLFQVILGGTTPIANSLFDSQTRWIGIAVDSDPEMTPRTRITAVPWALRAAVADSALQTGPPPAHNHDDLYYRESELNVPGTVNEPANPVDWTKLKGVPGGFADGTDDVGSGGGPGGGWVDDGTVVRLENGADKVGIGTADPQKKLHVKDATYAYLALETAETTGGAYSGIQFLSPVSGSTTERGFLRFDDLQDMFDWEGKENDIYIGNQAGSIYLNEQGNVGIGTTAPGAALAVISGRGSQPTPGQGLIYAQNTDDSPTANASACVATNSAAAGDPFFSCVAHGDLGWSFGLDNSDENKFKFSTDWADLAAATKVTFTPSGNVGIGTTNPLSKLDLGAGTGPKLRLFEDGTADGKAGFGVDMSGANYETSIYFQSNAAGHLSMGTWNGTTFSEKMRVTSSGKVGIGTNGPAYTLDVAGTTQLQGKTGVQTSPVDSVALFVRDTQLSGGPYAKHLMLLQRSTWNFPSPPSTKNRFAVQYNGQTSVLGAIDVTGDRGSSVPAILAKADGNGTAIRAEAAGSGPGLKVVATGSGDAADLQGNVVIRGAAGGIVLELGEGLDYAEGFDVAGSGEVEPGTVLVIDPKSPGELSVSTSPYDSRVAGIAAGAKSLGSGVRLGADSHDLDVALAGRVYCNVDATEEACRAGRSPHDLSHAGPRHEGGES